MKDTNTNGKRDDRIEEKKRMRKKVRKPERRRTAICLPSRLSVFIISCRIIFFIIKHRRAVKLIIKHGDLKANIAIYIYVFVVRERILYSRKATRETKENDDKYLV